MAKATQAELVTINTDVTIDKEDVLAVGITEAEEYMQTELKACQEDAADQGRQAREHSEARGKILAAAGKVFAKAIEEQLTEGLQCLNPKKLNYAHTVSELCMPPKGSRKPPTYNIQLQVQECNGRGLNLSRTFTERAPIEARDELRAEQACHAAQSESQNEAMEWKRRLSRIPQYERKLRAELAKKRLVKTASGKEILAAMLGDVKTRVLALPGK